MTALSFVLSIIAIIIAYLAYRKSGGALELKSKVEDLGITTDSLRDKTADALNRLEKLVRREQTAQSESQEKSKKVVQDQD